MMTQEMQNLINQGTAVSDAPAFNNSPIAITPANPNFNYNYGNLGSTAISSGTLNDTLKPNLDQRLATLSNKGSTQQPDGSVVHADGSVLNEGISEQINRIKGGAAETKDYARVPTGIINKQSGELVWTPQQETTIKSQTDYQNQLAAGTLGQTPVVPKTQQQIDADKDAQDEADLRKQMMDVKTQTDANTKALIDSLHQKFDVLRQQQQQINKATEAGRWQSLFESGTARYGSREAGQPSQADTIMGMQQSESLQNIAKLDAQESELISKAQIAQSEGDYKILDRLLTQAENTRKEKQAEATKANDAMTKRNQELSDQGQIVNALNSSAKTVQEVFNQLNGKVPIETIKSVFGTFAQNLGVKNATDLQKHIDDFNKLKDIPNGLPSDILALPESQRLGAYLQKIGTTAKATYRNITGVGLVQVNPDGTTKTIVPSPGSVGGTTEKGTPMVPLMGSEGNYQTPYKQGTQEFKIAQDLAYGALTFAEFRTLFAYSRDATKRQAIYNTAAILNPDFNPAAFELGFNVAKNTKIRQQVAAQDNVLARMPDLIKTSEEASRTGITALNGMIRKGGYLLGGKTYSNFNVAVTAFADELSGALGFGSATDMNREMGFNMTDGNLSPANFASSMREVILPFIQQKRQTLIAQMGIYGKDIDNMSGVIQQQEKTSDDLLKGYQQSNPYKIEEINDKISSMEKALGRSISSTEFLERYPEYK